tara:strand:- start:21481 stop:23034 length:1554 start_codon:yes stop_codon:yes gene_type:complete
MPNLQILKTKEEFDTWRRTQISEIIFVPTMGSLHEGHKRLIERAKNLNETKSCIVLVSIFVNPLQFRACEDFEKYPRDFDSDIEIAAKSGANAIWAPTLKEIFPGGIESNFKISVPTQLIANLCGNTRPGHFDGVATVVMRLLNISRPNVLVLGEKDWQQLIILKKLIQDFKLNIKVENVRTHRDIDGLPSSSRNKYLSPEERKKAALFSQRLADIANSFDESSTLDLKLIRNYLEKDGINVEYLSLVDPEYLQIIEKPSQLCMLGAAINIGQTRLIDHKFLMTRSPIVAIDGPAGAGKSTVTKIFAKKVGLMYLDTGAMYRAVTWFIKEKSINPSDQKNIEKALCDLNIKLEVSSSGDQIVIINEKNVTNEIRSPEVTSNVSIIASHKCVREALTFQQKQIGRKGGLVAEGRDIGTTVFPNAELKVFLTASASERAKRRLIDLQKRGFEVPDILALEKEISLRDKLDSTRDISPLLKANDAKEIITDGMNIEDVVNSIIDLFRFKVPEEIWPNPQS